MQDSLPWNQEQKRRAHARIFEDLMRRFNLTEAQVISRLGEDGPKSQSTISRWKTLDVKPNRHIYLDLLRNVLHLNYDQIDAMLWLSGAPPLLRQETTVIFTSSQIFYEKTEYELGLAAYKLLVDSIGTDLGLPAPEWEPDAVNTNEEFDFTFTVNIHNRLLVV